MFQALLGGLMGSAGSALGGALGSPGSNTTKTSYENSTSVQENYDADTKELLDILVAGQVKKATELTGGKQFSKGQAQADTKAGMDSFVGADMLNAIMQSKVTGSAFNPAALANANQYGAQVMQDATQATALPAISAYAGIEQAINNASVNAALAGLALEKGAITTTKKKSDSKEVNKTDPSGIIGLMDKIASKTDPLTMIFRDGKSVGDVLNDKNFLNTFTDPLTKPINDTTKRAVGG